MGRLGSGSPGSIQRDAGAPWVAVLDAIECDFEQLLYHMGFRPLWVCHTPPPSFLASEDNLGCMDDSFRLRIIWLSIESDRVQQRVECLTVAACNLPPLWKIVPTCELFQVSYRVTLGIERDRQNQCVFLELAWHHPRYLFKVLRCHRAGSITAGVEEVQDQVTLLCKRTNRRLRSILQCNRRIRRPVLRCHPHRNEHRLPPNTGIDTNWVFLMAGHHTNPSSPSLRVQGYGSGRHMGR